MRYCINPLCEARENPDDAENCLACGTSLVINGRICLIKPLRELTEDLFVYIEVFEVDDIGTKWNPVRKRRVIKVLKWNTPKLVELFERESVVLRQVRHPCIPESTMDDFFTFAPNNSSLTLHCLVMDKFEGQDLQQWIQSNGRISQSLSLKWMKQLVEILDVVHHTEFFHRDIKPANIILQPSGQLALVDFGTARRVTDTYLAKVSGSGGTSTRVGNYEITSVVSPCYTPPEQTDGQAVPQSDFYALGRTFVHLLTAIQLIDLPTDKQTGRLIWRNKAPQIDKPFGDFIDELMAPFPGHRPATTEVILQRLKRLPQQSKIYRLTRSNTFIISAIITSVTLVAIGVFKIGLPMVANNLVSEGEKLEAANDSQRAQEFFDSATIIHPQARFSVSKFYLEQASRYINNLELAKKYYELAIKYNGRDLGAYNSLAIVCRQLRELNCAIDSYQKILKLEPDWEGYYRLGSFYDDQGKEELAQDKYKIAIKLNKNAVVAINNLSRLKNLKKDYSQAANLALEGLNKTKEPKIQATLYKNVGWARLMEKKYSEAEKYLEKAIDLDSERIDAVCLLSQAQEALGKINETKLSWEVCMIAKSDQPEVYIWRQQLIDRLINNSKTTN